MKTQVKITLMALLLALSLVALWQVQKVAHEVRLGEEAKIRLWANAISQRNQMADATREFFEQATLDEHRKLRLYTDILQSFNDPDQTTDLRFSLAYIHYIVDSAHTPIIITTATDSLITVPQELAGQKLEGDLLAEYSHNPPFHYRIWGMPMALYYKESQYYTQLRQVLEGYTRSFLTDITANSVPVLIVDSSRRQLLALGNIDSSEVDTPAKLQRRLEATERSNTPVQITLPSGNRAYVYYEKSPLLRTLRWVPTLYLFIALVLLITGYLFFRTAHTMEQNRIWVGLAKETAHQLGTPISSLSGWLEYLRGKEFTPQYATEVEKDLRRLGTITQRFSKIGSVPELQDTNVRETVEQAVQYLEGRTSRKIHYTVSFPDDQPFIAPLNGHLFEWVIENLCRNAADAMDGAGTITIVGSQDTRHIYLDISDTGRGMSPSVQKHIFDSGFTTKARGWGLGLPLARRIINQYHRGRLYLKYSVPGQGSCFRIVLRKK
ncbi:MAG: HAMP domain-containing histidine kinase [Bacteroidales bacterium]|nr:HAMP domain-containing histidine kinase [Bacteroidales bacterium]